MRVQVMHCFEGAELSAVEALYMLDDGFNQQVFSRLGYGRRVLQKEQQGRRLSRTLRLCPQHALPAPLSGWLGDRVLSIREHVEYDLVGHRGSWSTEPSLFAHQFCASGTFRIGPDPRGVCFHLEGDIHASFPLLSRYAERYAVRTAEQRHAALAEAVRAELARAKKTRTPPSSEATVAPFPRMRQPRSQERR